MKKRTILPLLMILALSVFAGCSNNTAHGPETPQTPAEEELAKEDKVEAKEEQETAEKPKKQYPTIRVQYLTEEFPYKVIEEESIRHEKGTRYVKQKGIKGFKTEKYHVTYLDGKIIKKEKIETTDDSMVMSMEPVDEIVLIGTREKSEMDHLVTKNGSYYEHEKLEQAVFKAINKVRTDNGLNALEWQDKLSETAHASTMRNFENMIYEHHEGEAGENLFYLFPVDFNFDNTGFIVKGWMDSPAHRLNILDPEYKYTAVDVIIAEQYFPNDGGWQDIMYTTQHFMSEEN